MTATDHSLRSRYREMLLEHLFAGEVMRHAWLAGIKRPEILKPQVDDGGYDLVLEGNDVVRHVQLKATFRGSKVRRFGINTRLADKPSGCVVVLLFEAKTLSLGPFLWFGGMPGAPLPSLGDFRVGKQTKGNRVLPYAAFEKVATIKDVAERLFGKLPKP